MLTTADLEVNLLDFRHRTFAFDRLVEHPGGPYALFTRTETESERQLRPKLVHLTVVAPLAWVVYDGPQDALRISRDGAARSAGDDTAVEVAAEAPEFEEDGVRWKRTATGSAGYVYAPLELAGLLLGPEGLLALGFR